MAYKKPQIVAKSAAKQSFVAGCPSNTAPSGKGHCMRRQQCQLDPAM